MILYTYRYHFVFGAILLIYFFNLFIDVMEIDAAQYALISMEMSFTKSFLHVYQHGQDYLDKPPLLFWLSSLSYLMMGVSNFSYKLPSVLFAILGLYSTYRFAKLWYSHEKAILSALILGSSQALFLITNDVRTDTLLLSLNIFSIWQIGEFLKSSKWMNLVLGSLGIGAAMMAKGPIGLIIPGIVFSMDFLIKREWKNFLKPAWILLVVIVAISLIPMSYGLYTQFDLHPEKFVYGLQGPSGLKFFFWTQSFGRITGDIYWENDSTFFYFFHTILWDFQPWVLIFTPALIARLITSVREKLVERKNQEYISLMGFVLVFILFSNSNYKLPHYIFVLFPFAAIITADFIYQLKGKVQKNVGIAQFSIMHLFWILIILNYLFFFPPDIFVLPLILIGLFGLNWFVFLKIPDKTERIFIPTVITAIAFNLMMSVHFYPNLLRYQSSSMAAKMISNMNYDEQSVYSYDHTQYSFNFYTQSLIPTTNKEKIKTLSKGSIVFASSKQLEEIEASQIKYKMIKEFPSFKVSELSLPFLIQSTRSENIRKDYLIEIQ